MLNARIETLLVPLLLVAIAGNQIRLATTGTLSPWKGGGFGMFSSSDTPGSRFVTVHAEDEQGREIRLSLGTAGLSKSLTRRLSCMPSQADLELAAAQILEGRYVQIEALQDALLERLVSENPNAVLPRLSADVIVCRRHKTTDPQLAPSQLLKLNKVELRPYRLRFDRKRVARVAEPMGKAVLASRHLGQLTIAEVTQ